MKIVDVRTFVVGNPWKNWLFVKLYTDEGITGLGEATGGLSTKPHQADVEELAHLVIGEDPRYPGTIWEKMFKARFLNPSPGMNGIELACWDILGKSLGVPIWQLLGGKQRDSLRVYANGWYQGPRDPEFFAEKAAHMVKRGYTGLKFDPFGGAYLRMDRVNERVSVNIIRAVREAVGPDVDIMVEGHDRFTVSYAIRIGRLIEKFEPLWFEAPVHSLNLKGVIEVARKTKVPVAVGERFNQIGQFANLLATGVIDIVQPEVMLLGLSNTRKVCGIAEAYQAVVASHQAQSPLSTAINAHLHASIQNFLIQESFDDSFEQWTWDVLTGVPRIKKGYLPVPDAPGFGVELNESEALEHPYGAKYFLRLFEEGWETRRPPEG